MTPSRAAPALAAALALAAPAVRAVDLDGSLELNYQRYSMDTAGGRIDVPSWNFGGQLSLSGLPVDPKVLQASAHAEYRRYHNLYLQTGSRMDNLGYGANLVALAGSPLTLSLAANRTQADFSGNTSGSVGSTATTTESATAAWKAERIGIFLATVSRADVVNDTFDRGRLRQGTTGLLLNASGGFGPHWYSLQYDTSWNDGSLVETNYRAHRVEMHGRSEVARDVEVRLDQYYFLRDPTIVDPASPRVDDVSVGVGATWGLSGPFLGNARYGYHHSVVDAPGLEVRESLANDASASAEWKRSASFTWLGSLGLVQAVQRSGTTETSGASESASAGARWTGDVGSVQAMLTGSASAGALQIAGGGGEPGWGVSAGASLTRSTQGWYGTAAYAGSYSKNLGGVRGSTQTHQLAATGETALAPDWRLTGTLLGNALLLDDDVIGRTRNESLQASIGTSWRRHSLLVTAFLSEGVSPALGIAPGGPTLPSQYDTTSWTLSAKATVGLMSRLSLSVLARTTTTAAPGVPDRWERGASAYAAYGIGAFALSLEDTWSQGGSDATSTAPEVRRSGNVLMFRIVRSFGSRY